MFCYAGTGVGTSGNPTDWLNSTHTLTFAPAATLTAGDSVEIHQRFTVAQYNRFINLAIEKVAKEALVYKVDTSIELTADIYSYTLSTQFMAIIDLEMETSTADVYDGSFPIDLRGIRIIPGSTMKLEFDKNWFTPVDGRNLRIRGYASPSILDTDTEECPINPDYVANQAAARLHQSRIRRGDADEEYHTQQMGICQANADIERRKLVTSVTSGIWVVE